MTRRTPWFRSTRLRRKLLASQGGERSPLGIFKRRNRRLLLERLEDRALLAGEVFPNDPDFPQQWELHNTGQNGAVPDADIDAPEAWTITTGSMATVLAEIDDGVDYTHPDLYLNIWLNQGEIPPGIAGNLTDTESDGIITFRDLNSPTNASFVSDLNGNSYIDAGDLLANPSWENGLDEDGNGFADDLIGWDFEDNDNDPYFGGSHGTGMTLHIGADANNGVGGAGINWRISMMPVRFWNRANPVDFTKMAAGLDYAVAEGAPLSALYGGNYDYSQAMYDSINAARLADHLVIAPSANDSANNDVTPRYPASFDLDNIISAMSVNQYNGVDAIWNYGAISVDLAAPTQTGGGTSGGAARTAGVAALLKSAHPDWTYAQIKERILSTVDPLPSLAGKTVTGGRLNAANALAPVQVGFNFADFSNTGGLALLDDVAITSEQTLRISDAIPKSRGSVWFTEKQFVSVGFETEFDFRMMGGGQYGMAFVIQNESPSSLGRDDTGMGYSMIANSLAVEFDTFLTPSHGDLNDNHVGVQANGTEYNSASSEYSLGSASPQVDLNDGSVHKARIKYVPGTLSVYVDNLLSPLLSVAVNLSETLDLDLGRAWVGFTSASWDQRHEVLSWEYHTLVDTTEAIGIRDVSQSEGQAGAANLAFTIVRLGDTSGATAVNWSTSDGTADAPADYSVASGQVSFETGETEKTITVTIQGDTSPETNETLFVNLSISSGNAVLVEGKAVGGILNDDTTISIDDSTGREGSQIWRFVDEFVPAVTSTLVSPRYTIFGPDGHLYIGSRLTDDVQRFDGTTGEFLGVFADTVPAWLDDPRGLVFGPDGNLYVSAYDNRVLRYHGVTGAYMDDFVAVGSGGLERAEGLTFGPDGNLYVADRDAHKVLRFHGATGEFIDDFVSAGSGGLLNATAVVFGPDGNLYVGDASGSKVLRFHGTTGAFINEFVPQGSGGLNLPQAMVFGSDGDLYVSSTNSHAVLRYNGITGAFVEAIGLTSHGFAKPNGLAFGQNGLLYVASNSAIAPNGTENPVLRYGRESLVALTVTLSTPAGIPVTVNYATASGTALAGSDFASASGTVTFAPGQTSRTILVPTLDDAAYEGNETFVVNLSSPMGGVIADSQGVGTIIDNDIPPTKFYVVDDATANKTFEYGATGAAVENYSLNSGNSVPRGATSTVAGDKTWVVDANKKVYVYNTSGGLLGSWTAGTLTSNATVEGVTTNGTDVWIVDAKQDKVFRYTGAASRLSGSQNAASSFNLNSGNASPKDLVTDGASIWVVNDAASDKVFKYNLAGTLLGSWTMSTSGANAPTGITLDPASPSHLWIVDSGTDRVYQYDAAVGRTSGSQSASTSFALAAGNTNPQGIADPPLGASDVDVVLRGDVDAAHMFVGDQAIPSTGQALSPAGDPDDQEGLAMFVNGVSNPESLLSANAGIKRENALLGTRGIPYATFDEVLCGIAAELDGLRIATVNKLKARPHR